MASLFNQIATEWKGMVDAIQSLKRETSSFKQQVSAMEITMQDVKKENGSLRDKQADMEKKVSVYREENKELRKKLDKARLHSVDITDRMEEENKHLTKRMVELGNDHVKRIQKLESDHQMVAQTKRVWGRSLVLAQAEAEMKNKLSDRELTTTPAGATALTGATAPTGATAKSGTGGGGGKFDTQHPPPSRQPPRPLRTKEEIENIKRQSPFHVSKSRSSPAFRVPRGPTPTPIEGYDETRRHSPYFDMTTGIYTVPLKGKCVFWVRDDGEEGTGSLDWFMCRGDGRRERVTGRKKVFGGYWYDDVEWECEEGDKVWVEGVGVRGDVMVKRFGFGGRMLD